MMSFQIDMNSRRLGESSLEALVIYITNARCNDDNDEMKNFLMAFFALFNSADNLPCETN